MFRTAHQPRRLLLCSTLLALTAVAPVRAESLVSSASSAGSSAASSLSDSLQGSSGSSQRDVRKAQGEYRILALAPTADGRMRVSLQPLAEGEGQGDREALALLLPPAAVAAGRLAPEGVVRAEARPYGLQWHSAATSQAFFLLLDDAHWRGLQTRAL
jgi:hypothetical protein